MRRLYWVQYENRDMLRAWMITSAAFDDHPINDRVCDYYVNLPPHSYPEDASMWNSLYSGHPVLHKWEDGDTL